VTVFPVCQASIPSRCDT